MRASSGKGRSLEQLDLNRSGGETSVETTRLREDILAKLIYVVGKDTVTASKHDWFVATAHAVRDRVVDRWMHTNRRTYAENRKRIYYLSVEYLIGRLLFDTLGNLGLTEVARAALAELDVGLDELRAIEPDQALGNGGLGRLAACFMDSMASLGLPAHGYGIRYDHGLFKQHISDGWQHELPEDWLAFGNPWEFERPEVIYPIRFGGVVEYVGGDADTARAVWYPNETVQAVAFDTPVVGWRGRHVNTLRLWSARATDPIHLYAFNQGDFVGAMAAQARAEAISRVLYPSDETASGQELRLRQEYFFTSASLQDLLRRHRAQYQDLASLPDYASIQLNDTHPAIAVAELMRLLVDEHEFSWTEAWSVTTRTLNYTNHTLLPEALESWQIELMGRLLPRHMQIIYLINWHHLEGLTKAGFTDPALLASVSLIQETGGRRVRMGHLAFIGSNHINGVSALHTDLLRSTLFKDLDTIRPGRIVNKTNGISFRRWLHRANPGLTRLLVERLGEKVLDDPEVLREAEALGDDPGFLRQLAAIRRSNKEGLLRLAAPDIGTPVDPSALFDVQIKRIHEYKRQLLNILETVALYHDIRRDPQAARAPRVKILAGKAAASYQRAKLIIKLACDVGRVINSDPLVRGRLKLLFLPNYNVSLAEAIIPASDLSEQISTAGMEASGTGNMKLALNGALTIGTLDGANIEIKDRVGADNIFIFGMTAEGVAAKLQAGFTGGDAAERSPALSEVLESLRGGLFSPDEPGRYAPLVDAVLGRDPFMVAADFDSYWDAQRAVDARWADSAAWWKASLVNTARMGWFSSDRAISEYAQEIWGVGRMTPKAVD
jgi:starch phosphorylase